MSVASRVVQRLLGLPPAVTRRVSLQRNNPVRTRDGVALMTDHYAPDVPDAATILIRSPYGRRGTVGLMMGNALAECGFHVVLQSCRGTFDSGGDFVPMRHEHDDGMDTLDWVTAQPWFTGKLFTYGPSYVGYTQWAIAADAGDRISGMLTAVTASSFRAPTYAGGSFSLDTILNWATLVHNQGGSLLSFIIKQARRRPYLKRAWTHLPLGEADLIAAGAEIAFFREWLASAEDEDYWLGRAHGDRIESVTAPVCMVGGWMDIFLPWQLADYARMRAAGHRPRLVIGPWTHASQELFGASIAEGVDFFNVQLGRRPAPTNDVHVFVQGADEWRDFETWPPAGRTTELAIRPGGALDFGTTAAIAAGPKSDRFRYDPADPTPSVGGALFTTGGGPVDNRALEARPDVLVYSSEPLSEAIEAVGPVVATIAVRTSSEFFDLFVRLCDVHPDGRSINVCDGLTRVDPHGSAFATECPPDADGIRRVPVDLWPTAYRFQPGHRLRVQVSGGAHPRWARNSGTGDPMATASVLVPVDVEVFESELAMHQLDVG
jgi:putative CocE/NonD family hydrolase